MTPNDITLFGLNRSTMILHKMLDEFTPADWLHRPAPDANPAAWIVGHLVTVERACLKHLTADLPELPYEGFVDRHNKGGTPGPAEEYGDVLRLLPLFDAHRRLFVDRVTAMTPADFDRPLDHPTFQTLGQFVALIPMHTGLHLGQISTIRRTLGKPAIF